jgi:hypothetical protein
MPSNVRRCGQIGTVGVGRRRVHVDSDLPLLLAKD